MKTTLRLITLSILLLTILTLIAACGGPSAEQSQTNAIEAQSSAADEHTDHEEAAPTRPAAPAVPVSSATEDVLYVFGSGRISIIEPHSARVVAEITSGLEGIVWGDALASADNQLIFANDRTNAQVIVIDSATQQIIKRIPVGGKPVHMYNPLHGDEMWTHSDDEGTFYVINTTSLEVIATVAATTNGTGHGKLRYHEALGTKAYATNTGAPAVFVIDLASKQVVKVIEVCEGVGGTHGKGFSPVSGHAYFECGKAGKTAVIDTKTDTLVKHLDGSGQLFETPDGTQIAVMDKKNNRIHIIDAAQDSTIVASIDVAGTADKIYFYQRDGRTYGFTTNTMSPDTAVINMQELTVVKRIAAGDIARPEGATSFHRGGEIGGGFFFTPASGDGVVSIINARTLTLHAAIPVGSPETIVYVGQRGGQKP